MREHCSLVARSVLSLSSSLVHRGLELSIMNMSCHASHLDRDPNILDQVETLSTRLKLPHFSRDSSPTCNGSVLRSTTIIPDFSLWNCFKVAFHIFTNGTKTLGLNLTQRFKITDEGTWVYVKSVKSVIKLLPFHRYCKHWKVITIYYSFWEDGLANNQTEREHGDVQVKVAIPGNILYNKQKPLIL